MASEPKTLSEAIARSLQKARERRQEEKQPGPDRGNEPR